MISLISSLLPILSVLFYFIYIRYVGGMGNYVKFLSSKKNGLSCYECNSDLDDYETSQEEPRVCKSCERDRRVSLLINTSKSRSYDFHKMFFNSKFEKSNER